MRLRRGLPRRLDVVSRLLRRCHLVGAVLVWLPLLVVAAGSESVPNVAPAQAWQPPERRSPQDPAPATAGQMLENLAPLPILKLTDEQIQAQGLKLETAASGAIATTLNLPGKIVLNGDHLAHVVPRIPGVVREVHMSLGTQVTTGEVLAVIDSRELADATAGYLGARERLHLAQATYQREENLWRQKISATQDYLNAKNALAEARIDERAMVQKLLALGFKQQELTRLSHDPRRALSRYEIPAPFSGTIIEKDISLGEALEGNATICVVADLSTVWADLSIFPQDLAYIRVGERVKLRASGTLEAAGNIAYVQPIVNEETRRTFARVILDNRNGEWRPGLFVNAEVAVQEVIVPVLVPRTALQAVNNHSVIFVQTHRGIEPRWTLLGRMNETHAEVVYGVSSGERFISNGSFILKAELEKEQIQ